MTLTRLSVWPRLRPLPLAIALIALLAVPTLTTSVSAREVEPINVAGIVQDASGRGNVTFDSREFSPSAQGVAPIALLLPAVQSAREGCPVSGCRP